MGEEACAGKKEVGREGRGVGWVVFGGRGGEKQNKAGVKECTHYNRLQFCVD
jgi:hypothetical protein